MNSPYRRFLVLVSIVLALASPSLRPASAVAGCLDWIRTSLLGFDWLTEQEHQQLAGYYQAWLADAKAKQEPGLLFRSGNLEYRATARLGSGGEGTVYLAQASDGKLEVIKKYKDPQHLVQNPGYLVEMKKKGVNAVDVKEVNQDGKFLRLEYVVGIPVDRIRFKHQELGLSEATKDKIISRFDQFNRDAWKKTKRTYSDFNVVFEFASGRFVVIDPY